MVREVCNISLARESKKLDAPNSNLKCSHVSNEIRDLGPLTMNVCPLKLGDNIDGLGSIGNENFMGDVGYDSDIKFGVNEHVHGLYMSDIELGVDDDVHGLDMSYLNVSTHHEEISTMITNQWL